MTVLQKEYKEYKEKYMKMFGKNTCVFLQVGSFFEIYQASSEEDQYIYEIAQICNWHVAVKSDKTSQTEDKILMIGVPCIAIEKYLNILLKHNYTVVVFTQSEKPGKKTRKLSYIMSPSINDVLPDDVYATNSYCTVLHLEKETCDHNMFKACVCAVDVSTGKSFVFTFSHKDIQVLLGEVYKIFHTYGCKELLLHTNVTYDVIKILNLHEIKLHIINELPSESSSKNIIREIYTNNSQNETESIVEMYESFEHDSTCVKTFACLLEFIFQIDNHACAYLRRPVLLLSTEFLTLFNNAIHQLNITSPDAKEKTNISCLLNKCKTKMGKREFSERLCRPLIDSENIEKRYDQISEYLHVNSTNEKRHYLNTREILSNISDIEKLQRRIITQKIHPSEFKELHGSYQKIITLLQYLEENKINEKETHEVKEELSTFIDEYNKILDFEDEFLFICLDKHPEIQEKFHKMTEAHKNIELIYNSFCEKFQTEKIKIKLDIDKENCFSFNCLPSKGEQLKQQVFDLEYKKDKQMQKISKFQFTFTGSMCKISCDEIKIMSNTYSANKLLVQESMNSIFKSLLEEFSKYNDFFNRLASIVSSIDISSNNAKIAFDNNYTRPVIHKESSTNSFVNVAGLRHPIIEQILDVPYVPNNVKLDKSGLLIYGCNSAGKSSLMKSVGIAIVMAQAGMYTACVSMTYYPFRKLLTRIISKDDLFKNQSTFTYEMGELRNILTYCDEYSLVLSDELSTGTEITSALSIVCSSICEFHSKKVCYVMASHLHKMAELQDIRDIVSENRLSIKHLYVYYDSNMETLIFDRKLHDGIGNTLYGLEICEYLCMSDSFIQKAHQIRECIVKEDTKKPKALKKSRYNSAVLLSKCNVCLHDDATETHHIVEQEKADRDGMVLSAETKIHKNVSSNLVPLCKSCHYKVTYGSICIHGWLSTANGKKLHWNLVNPP